MNTKVINAETRRARRREEGIAGGRNQKLKVGCQDEEPGNGKVFRDWKSCSPCWDIIELTSDLVYHYSNTQSGISLTSTPPDISLYQHPNLFGWQNSTLHTSWPTKPEFIRVSCYPVLNNYRKNQGFLLLIHIVDHPVYQTPLFLSSLAVLTAKERMNERKRKWITPFQNFFFYSYSSSITGIIPGGIKLTSTVKRWRGSVLLRGQPVSTSWIPLFLGSSAVFYR